MSASAPVVPAAPAAAPAVPTTVNSAIDAAFAAAVPAAPAAPSTELAPTTGPLISDPGTSVTPVTAPTAMPVSTDDLDLSDIGEASKSEDGKRFFYPERAARKLEAAKKFVQGVQEIIPGVTVSDIQSAFEIQHAAQQMMLLFDQGASDPNAIDGVLEPFIERNNPKAFGAMTVRMINKLSQVEPGALQFIRRHFNAELIEFVKTQARQAMDPAVKKTKVALVQQLQLALTNGTKWEKEAEILAGGTTDPIAAERAELDRRKAELDRELAQRDAQRNSERESMILSEQLRAQDDEIIALIPQAARDFYKNTPQWDGIMRDFRSAVENAETSHQEWRVRLENLRMEAKMSPTPQALSNFTNYWRSIVRQVALSNARDILDRWGNTTIRNNQQANSQAANHPPNEPAPNGVAATAANGVNLDAALKSKSFDEVWKHLGM